LAPDPNSLLYPHALPGGAHAFSIGHWPPLPKRDEWVRVARAEEAVLAGHERAGPEDRVEVEGPIDVGKWLAPIKGK